MVLGVVSLGAAAFQLLPTAQLVVEAGRRSGIPDEDAIEGGWSFRSLVTFFFPFFGVSAETPHRDLAEAVAYVGWVPMALVPLALFDDRRRRIAIFFSVLAAVAVATVCVDLPVYRVHHAILPGFRYPGRVLFLATLSLAGTRWAGTGEIHCALACPALGCPGDGTRSECCGHRRIHAGRVTWRHDRAATSHTMVAMASRYGSGGSARRRCAGGTCLARDGFDHGIGAGDGGYQCVYCWR